MAAGEHPFIDIAVREEVREHFAAGDALVLLDAGLTEVIWANGAGAALFGERDVGSVIGAASPLGIAARRQVQGLYGFPHIGRDRSVMVRMGGGALTMLASFVGLPGEDAILLAVPATKRGARSDLDMAERVIGGFSEPGQFLALVDARGNVSAASSDFAQLGISTDTLAALATEVASEGDRLVKRRIDASGRRLPAGLARLTDELHLLVVVDETAIADEADEDPAGEQHAGSTEAGETVQPSMTDHDDDAPAADETVQVAGSVEASSSGQDVGTVQPETTEAVTDAEAKTTDGPETTAEQRAAGPVRFVWRTDAEGRISELSPDIAGVVGAQAADVVGRSFAEVCRDFGMDPAGEITGLLERRDTWSGRTLLWPVAGTDLRVPVDLAALPVYGRSRNFEGFRGFGVARSGDTIVDPEARGLTLGASPAATQDPASDASAQTDGPADGGVAEPGRMEPPALRIVPRAEPPVALERTPEKVVRLAEHRLPANDRGGLSPLEQNTFREIGERLKKDTGSAPAAERRAPADAASIHPAAQATILDGNETGARAPAPGLSEMIAAEAEIAREAASQAIGADDAVSIPADEAADKTADMEAVPAEETAGDAPVADEGSDAAVVAQYDPYADLDEAVSDTEDDAGRPDDDMPPAMAAVAEAGAAEEAEPAFAPAARSQDEQGTQDGGGHHLAVPTDDRESPDAVGTDQPSEYLEDFRDAADEPSGSIEADPDVVAPPMERDVELAPELADGQEMETADDDDGFMRSAYSDGRRQRPPVDTSILDRLPVPVLIHSGDVLHYANREFIDFTAYASVDDLADRGGLGELFAEPYPAEEYGGDRKLRLRRGDGLEMPVEAFLQSVPWNGGTALLLSLRRIGRAPLPMPPASGPTAEEKAALESRIDELGTIIDTATDGVILIGDDANVRSISRPAEALFGLDSDAVAGKPFVSLFAIESQRAARDYLNGLSDNGVASVLNDGREVIGREAEGRFIPLFMTIGRLPNRSGYCAVVRDITQWKRAEEDLTQARAQAERASSQKTEFLARVSHEIRTPLNAIIGFSELMMDEKFGPVGNDRYRDYLRDINRSGNHVLDLVNDLLDISKIEAGQQEMNYEAVALNDTLAESVAMMQPQANRERVIIRSSFASGLPDVVADLRTIRQIALNLLSNAIRYTQAGGQVIVSTAYETSGDVVLRFRDTGIGMSPAEIEQALKPFKQINAIKRPRGDGTGLGLPLTKAMVEANRARFSILSTPGEGTLVEITFPSTRVLAD